MIISINYIFLIFFIDNIYNMMNRKLYNGQNKAVFMYKSFNNNSKKKLI